jgi:peptidoglycan hydrolase-like protein with peptidoglycan-binding domain
MTDMRWRSRVAIAATSLLLAGTAGELSGAQHNPCPPGQSREKTNQPCAPTEGLYAENRTQIKGQRVRSIQQALKGKGYDPGALDGKMGPKTETALRAFQKAEGLRVTGRLDIDTRNKLGL